MASAAAKQVSLIDTRTNRVAATLDVPDPPLSILGIPTAVWVASLSGDSVMRIEPS